MPLLSDYVSFDRQMGKRAECGIKSQTANNGNGFTIEEVSHMADYPLPVSDNDLKQFADFCVTWGIKTNIDTVQYFAEYRRKAESPI